MDQVIDGEKVLFDDLTVLSNDHLEAETPLEREESKADSHDLSHRL